MSVNEKIANLFDLPVESAPLCDVDSCNFVIDCLVEFYNNDCRSSDWITVKECDAFGHSIMKLQETESCEKIEWLPDYGCALMKTTNGCPPGEVAMNLIGLDLHHFQTSSKSTSSGGYQYVDTGFANDYEVLPIGISTLEELPDQENAFQKLLHSVKSRTGDNRSARGGKQGHQKTPAFIHALYRQVFSSSSSSMEELPRGGFTDVGLHTGGMIRSTSGPLVFSLLHQTLQDYEAQVDGSISSSSLFDKIVIFFGLFMSQQLVDQYDEEAPSPPESNAPHLLLEHAFHILRSAALKAAPASDDGLDMSAFIKRSRDLRQEIMQRASEASAEYSKQFILPQDDAEICGHFDDFTFNLPKPFCPAVGNCPRKSEIFNNECQNLGWIPLAETKGLEGIHEWMKESVPSQKHNSQLSILVLQTVEHLMHDFIKDLPQLNDYELDLLADVVDDYRETLNNLQTKGELSTLSLSQLKSRELLVVWIAFCVIHNSAVACHRHMEGFGVPLDFKDMSHLVLSRKEEWEAAAAVAGYLNKYGTDRPLFSLKEEEHTFNFGLLVCKKSSNMLKIWEKNKHDAQLRIEGRWREVLAKQKKVRRLRAEIAQLERKRDKAKCELDSKERELSEHETKQRESRRHSHIEYDSKAHKQCQQKIERLEKIVNDIDSELWSKHSSLQSARKAPEPVIQPLPEEEDLALPIIFFLYMPHIFQLLSRFSFTAQQLLIPKPWNSVWGGSEGNDKSSIEEFVTRRGDAYCQLSLKDHYNGKQESPYHDPEHSRPGSDYALHLCSVSNDIPNEIGHSYVDCISDKNDGVWYPDELRPRMAWFGGPHSFDRAPSGSEINPFVKLDHFYLVNNFTERFQNDEHLQWTVIQPGIQHILPSRGNLPYARQNQRPNWLTIPEFLVFANLRSYPNIQLRNALVAIKERQLPFNETCVHTLINQALFQIGDMSLSNSGATFEWRRDLSNKSFCKDTYDILASFVDELKDAPKNYKCVKWLGGVCNFFSGWEPSCRLVARRLARSVHGWAASIGRDIDTSSPSLVHEIRAKQVVLYQHAIITLAGGSLNDSDVKILIEMLFKARNFFTGANRKDEIQDNEVEVQYVISRRVDDILKSVSRYPCIITKALTSFLPRCPAKMKWKRWVAGDDSRTQCFKCLSTDGSKYSVNLISGEVLINGLPPSRLPLSILQHQLYRRTFGDRQFEVVQKGGFLETCRPIFGRFYKFCSSTSPNSHVSSLTIFEFKEDESELLELIDVTNGSSKWSKDIPMRLTNMHSHWFYRDEELLVLRGINFNDRNISYLIDLDLSRPSSSSHGIFGKGEVKCVDAHHPHRDQLSVIWDDDLLDTRLVLHQSPVLDILSKFEPKEFIHSYVSSVADGKIKFHLPRYKMTFELNQGALECQEISGYKLMMHQQMDDTLRGIATYLLLESTSGIGQNLIIFPEGEVRTETHGIVDIAVPTECDAELLWYQFEFHSRFKYVETKQSRASRMQLVALHIATTSLLPDKLLDMTGEERAITLIRQCWGNRPLNKQESLVMENIMQLARGKSPALSILCRDIEKSSRQMPFLYGIANEFDCHGGNNQCFEASAYLSNVKSSKLGSRCYLTKREEARAIGIQARRPHLPPRFTATGKIQPCPVNQQAVEQLQKDLDAMHSTNTHKAKKQKTDYTFPLNIKSSSKLEKDMIKELKESWDANHNSTPQHTDQTEIDIELLRFIKGRTTEQRETVEEYALNSLNERQHNCSHWHNDAHEMLKIAGLIPSATLADLARIAIEDSLIQDFNPILNDESCNELTTSIITWLRLCVLEDKLARITASYLSGSTEDAIKDLQTKLVSEMSKHTYWLVFEVENGLTIRPEQYKVAQHLIVNPGHIIQLNMGLGKTRVILPMLVLYFSFRKNNKGEYYLREQVTRLHFLSALYEEALQYLQNHLTASILCVPIYTMPFCRDFQLDTTLIARMKNALKDCRLDGGALIVAPEHRLSLELKAKELFRNGDDEVATGIDGLIKEDRWRDILDECDELLHHRYQLIYAVGAPTPLPGGVHRFRAIQALCHALARNDDLKEYLEAHRESCQFAYKSNEQWPEVQFFNGQSLGIMLGDPCCGHSPRHDEGLLSKLADVIIHHPPHELKWMLDHPNAQDIKKTMVDRDYHPVLHHLHEDHLSDVLALRGLLAGGILRHCLLKRHRVNYGISRSGKKRLAVPFRFADTPDERREFAHPDCAIAFTLLAYYHDGLTKDEFMQALKTLTKLGLNAQRNFYNRWLEISFGQLESSIQKSLDCIAKIDLTNEVQMEIMHSLYCHNMHTIDFYLNYCVFPTETDQFDSRLTATSWNLAHNPSQNIVGFSGTNDNWRILPLQVKQYFASHYDDSDPVLKASDGTNGRMLRTIMESTVSVELLAQDSEPFESLIDFLKCRGTFHSVIDCGALLAGCDLGDFSKRILLFLPQDEFGGVLYYDNDNVNDWVVLERSGRILPKNISPISEKDAFAIFDEPRCRGTDLKLKKDAVALLTLAPNVCKDKLMQSAGRLRKLGQGQQLVMVGGSDVFTQLRELMRVKIRPVSSSLTPQTNALRLKAAPSEVLSWSMKNAVESTAAGLFNWANQAYFFTSTFEKDPHLSITEEVLDLKNMYGKTFARQSIIKSTSETRNYHFQRTGGETAISESMESIIKQTNMRVKEYGGDFYFAVRKCDEECERELEIELEEDEEVEIEVPPIDPRSEESWNFQNIFSCKSPRQLSIANHSLRFFVKKHLLCEGSTSINWATNIYITPNFAKTVKCSPNSSLSLYLRVVNFSIRFPDGSILLLSEYEANHILGLFWKIKRTDNREIYHFLHTSLVRQSLDDSEAILFQSSVPKSIEMMKTLPARTFNKAVDLIGDESMASLQLFAGEPAYVTEERRNALKSLLRSCLKANFCPLAEARRLIEMRGNEKLFPYSDAETVCEQLLCEL